MQTKETKMHKKLKYNITLCTFQTKTVYEKGKTGKNNKTKMQFCCKDYRVFKGSLSHFNLYAVSWEDRLHKMSNDNIITIC